MSIDLYALHAFRTANLGGNDAIANVTSLDKVVKKNDYHGALGKIFRGTPTKAANNAARTELLRALGIAFNVSGMSVSGDDKVHFSKAFMDKGQLVPDDVIIGIVKDYLETHDLGKGCILDGVPRTLAQARMLDEMGVAIDAAISLEVGDAAIEERMGGVRQVRRSADHPSGRSARNRQGAALRLPRAD